MEYLDAVVKTAIGVIVTIFVGWLIAVLTPLRERVKRDVGFRTTFVGFVTIICLLLLAFFAYDRFIIPSEVNRQSQPALMSRLIATPGAEQTTSCDAGYYAVGVTVTGNGTDKCIGCLNSIRVACKKLQ